VFPASGGFFMPPEGAKRHERAAGPPARKHIRHQRVRPVHAGMSYISKKTGKLFAFQQKPCYILLRLMPAYFPALRLRTNSTKV
jgi:hypothetical protein